MINASTITAAIETQLKNVLSSDYAVERSGYINMNPDLTPWVGVYRGELTYDPATLGTNSGNWKAIFEPKVVVQSSSFKSGEQAEERLEEYIETVLDALMSDKTFKNTVAMLTGVSISYSYNEAESETLYFQMAEIVLTVEVRTDG